MTEENPWRATYLGHSTGCAECRAAETPAGQCDTGRSLYEAARVEANR